MDDVLIKSLLYDFYGQLLTEHQQSIYQHYYGQDLSLAEIAEYYGISRQAVYDHLKRAEKSLAHYEQSLGLIQRFQENERRIQQIHQLSAMGPEEQAISRLATIHQLSGEMLIVNE